MNDWQLLQQYAQRGSEEAFRALVERHLPLVHAAALRQVNEPHLAEEVTQAVFILLARKASSLRASVLLPGWLFRTTRFVATRAARAERRRLEREREAFAMQQADTSEAADRRLTPLLDEALSRLRELDRNALLLRFGQERSLREVGRELGLSEEATRKRVSRALERLRSFFARRGFTVSSVVLAGVLSRRLVAAPPEGLVHGVVRVCIAEGAAGGGSNPSALVREALNAWRWSKLQLAGGLVATALSLGSIGFMLLRPSATPSRLGAADAVSVIPLRKSTTATASRSRAATRTRGPVSHLHVVAKDTGEPIANAPLAVNTVTGEGWNQRFDLSTDPIGSADVPYPRTTARFDVGVLASGWAARFATWRTDLDSEIPADYTIRLDRLTAPMGGWLRDEKGAPVANAIIQMEFGGSDMAQEENPRERPGFVWPAPVTRSDSDGRWSCAVVDPKSKRTPRILAVHPNFAPAEVAAWSSGREPSAVQTGLWKGDLVTIMHRGLRLLGKVTDEQDRPISGAQVVHKPSSSDLLQTESDGGGWFAFEGLPSASFDFIVTAPGFAQQYLSVTVQEGMPVANVRLTPGGLLRLHVVDENGADIVGASVGLTGLGGMYSPSVHWNGETDLDGLAEWTSAAPNQLLNVCAWKKPEFPMNRGIMAKADGQEHVVHLARAFAISARVTDAQTGELLRRELKAFPGYGEGENSWFRGETRRTTNGVFQIHFEQEGFPVRLRVEAAGYVPFVSEPLPVEPSVTKELKIGLQPLDPAAVVRGTVWRTDGQPASGAEVALVSPEHGASLGRACFADRSPQDQLIVSADASGRFSFPSEPGATAIVAVDSNGFARVPRSDGRAPLDVRLHPWGRIEGQIEPSARTRPVASVEVDDLLALSSSGGVRLDRQTFSQKTTDDGHFSFDFLPDGLLCVWLDVGVITDPHLPAFHHPAWVQVNPGETANVAIAETGCRVKGRFVLSGREGAWAKHKPYAALEGEWPPGAPSSGQGLDARQWINAFFDPGRLIIASDGQFESRDPLRPGKYRLVGKIEGVILDQPVEVPDPANDFVPGGFGNDQGPVIDLGDIAVTGQQAGAAKAQ